MGARATASFWCQFPFPGIIAPLIFLGGEGTIMIFQELKTTQLSLSMYFSVFSGKIQTVQFTYKYISIYLCYINMPYAIHMHYDNRNNMKTNESLEAVVAL